MNQTIPVAIFRQGGSRDVVQNLAADQSNSTTTPTVVNGILFPNVGPGTWCFEYWIRYQAAATTTGVRFSVNHTGTVTAFVANVYGVDNTTAASAAANQAQVGATGGAFFAFSARAKSAAGWGTTVSVDTANADMLMKIEGILIVTAVGNLELYHGSEVAAATTIKAGTVALLRNCS